MVMVVSRISAAEVVQRYSWAVRDVTRSICRVGIAEWSTIQEEYESGEVRHALLTDEDAPKGAGYGHLQAMTGSSARRLGDSWMKLVVMTASLLRYTAVEQETMSDILNNWGITNSSHKDCQKEGVSIREMLSDLRASLKDCRDRFKRVGKGHKGSRCRGYSESDADHSEARD